MTSLKDKISTAFDRQASAMTLIAEGVAELSEAEALEVLNKTIAIIRAETGQPAPGTRTRRPTKRQRIFDLVVAGYSTIDEIVAQMKISKPAVTNHLGVLVTSGKVVRSPNGEFKEKR